MSDQTGVAIPNDAQVPSDEPKAPAKPRKPKAGGTSYNALKARTSFSVTDLARARLRKRGVLSDDRLSDECKVVRGILRSNFELVRKGDANVRKAKDTYNDRKPWPTNMGKATFAIAVEGKRAK